MQIRINNNKLVTIELENGDKVKIEEGRQESGGKLGYNAVVVTRNESVKHSKLITTNVQHDHGTHKTDKVFVDISDDHSNTCAHTYVHVDHFYCHEKEDNQ